jgi:hydrogenase maturation protease
MSLEMSPNTPRNEKHDSQILVIGYGNTLRGDDGAGYLVAETVANWGFSQVRSIAVHQLLPELAADIASGDIVMFIDAIVAIDHPPAEITIVPLVADNNAAFSTHIITPQLLLGITQRLYGAHPTAYLLTIPGIDFTLGTSLSPIARTGQDIALDYLKRWLNDPTIPTIPTIKLCMK